MPRPRKRMSEDQHTEWKASWRDEHLKWLCAFANAQGGVLEIGRNDKGQAMGLDNAEQLMEELPNKLRNLLGMVPDVNLLEENGLPYVQIVVEPYPVPISYRGKYYYRSGSTMQALTGAALDRFLLGKTGKRWDAAPIPGVRVDDLNAESLTRFRNQATSRNRLGREVLEEDNPGLIEKLRLTEGQYLKRAAILLFHPDPERFFTGAAVRIGYFEGEVDLRYQDEVCGDLFAQARNTTDLLLTKYLKAVISYEGIQRLETYPVPEEALREAVLNAIVHRDYAMAAHIQIRVYPDRLQIWNPGALPGGWTLEKLLGSHPSRPFNPDVANAFFRAGEIETWGRGIQRIFDACREADTPDPGITVETGGFWINFPFSQAYRDSMAPGNGSSGKSEATTQERILALLRENPEITRKALADRIGITLAGVKYHLANLRQAGRIRHVGSARKGHWEVMDDTH